jgi:transcriptional regulator with XRE-family HTH domain
VNVGERIRTARKDVGLSQEEVARRAGLSLKGMGEIERGDIEDPHISSLAKIARALGVPLEDLIMKEEEDPLLVWARVASDEEYSRWIETASAHDLHNVWVSLSRVARGMEEDDELYFYADRIQQAVDQFIRIQGPPTGIRLRKSGTAGTQEDRRERDIS